MYEIGEQVRIKSGVFASFTGEVEDVSEEAAKLKVTINLFAHPITLELSPVEVEQANERQRPWTNSSNN